MIIENSTRYSTTDLERILLLALVDAGITSHAHDRIAIKYSSSGSFTGWCYYGDVTPPILRSTGQRRTRMVLRLPPVLESSDVANVATVGDVRHFVWLIRHEVAHWQGLRHRQMSDAMVHTSVWRTLGCPLPIWAETITIGIEPLAVLADRKQARRALPDRDVERDKRKTHALAMLAKAERKAKLAATLVKRWTRRVKSADRAIVVAASKGDKS